MQTPFAKAVVLGMLLCAAGTRAEELQLPPLEGTELAAFWQQPPALSSPVAPAQPLTRSSRSSRQSGLASVPNMFGDLGGSSTIVRTIEPPSTGPTGPTEFSKGIFQLPVAGGGSRIGKISENDSPIPLDRIFFSYNHFHNAFELTESSPPAPTQIRQEPIDRYTLGLEKTFFEGAASVEVRMPLMGSLNAQTDSFGVSGKSVGNLTVVLKSLLYMDDSTAIGAGVAIETPTGTDLNSRLANVNLRFQNEAVHFLPYLGFVWSPGDPQWGWGNGLFLSGYAQIDINASSNAVDVIGPNNLPVSRAGRLTDQNLAFFDIAAGYWLFRDSAAPRVTGIAAITELHYTTTLQDADRIEGFFNGTQVIINETSGRFDVLNGTLGLQFLLFETSSLRVAGVFPIGDEDRRLFDSEVQVQFNRRF
jgi:hypothetical protein